MFALSANKTVSSFWMFNGRWSIHIRKQHWPMNWTLWPPHLISLQQEIFIFFTELQQPFHVISTNCFWCYVVCTTWLLYFLCHSDIIQTLKFCDLWHHILSLDQKVILTYFTPLLLSQLISSPRNHSDTKDMNLLFIF